MKNFKIEPTYVSFEQAKLLKDKGLIADCRGYWVRYTNTKYKELSNTELEDLDREIGIGECLIIPKYEQCQVVEWLRVVHGTIVFVLPDNEDDFLKTQRVIYTPTVYKVVDGLSYLYKELIRCREGNGIKYFNTPQEAYSAAFDYVLKELI